MGSAVSIVIDSSAVIAAIDELPAKRQRGYGKKLLAWCDALPALGAEQRVLKPPQPDQRKASKSLSAFQRAT